MRAVFIYALCEPGTRTVRYIGKTVSMRNRLRQHLLHSSRLDNHLGCWLRSLSGEPPNMVRLSTVTEDRSELEERRFISAARTSLGMDLVNGTDGGDGVTLTPEIIEKIRKTRQQPEKAASISASCREMWKNPEYRAKQTESRKASWTKPGARERRAKAQGDAARSEVSRQTQRENMKKCWENPKYRSAHASGMAKNREKFRAAASARVRLGIKRKNASSKFFGVSYDRTRSLWVASVVVKSKLKNLGRFSSEISAARCVDDAVRSYRLPNKLNFI